MLNLKATDYGLEPGTIGFEEAIELSYLDGEKEGKIEEKIKIAKKLIQNQFDDETIHKITEIPQEKIEKIKKEITK